jgi:hypothetical protein
MEEENILSLDFARNKASTIPTSSFAEAYKAASLCPLASAEWS